MNSPTYQRNSDRGYKTLHRKIIDSQGAEKFDYSNLRKETELPMQNSNFRRTEARNFSAL